MAVVQDTLSGPGGSGVNGHLFAGSVANGTTGFTVASFQSPSSSATLLVVGVAINDSLAAIGTMTVKWDSAGTNQSMTSIGSVQDSAAGVAIFFFGLVSPGTSGAKSIKVTFTGVASGDEYQIWGISYTGSISSTVAAATEGFQTATGTSAALSVTTSASIPSGDLEAAWFVTNGTSITATNNTTIDRFFDTISLGCACSSASGAGATITSTATGSVSSTWAAMTVGIKASTAVAIGLQPSTLLLPPMPRMVGWRGLQRLQAFPPAAPATSAFPTVPAGIIMIGS